MKVDMHLVSLYMVLHIAKSVLMVVSREDEVLEGLRVYLLVYRLTVDNVDTQNALTSEKWGLCRFQLS